MPNVFFVAVSDRSVLGQPEPTVCIVLLPCVKLVFFLAVSNGKLRERGRELQLPAVHDVLLVGVPDQGLSGRRFYEEQRVRVVSDVLVDTVPDPRLPERRCDE